MKVSLNWKTDDMVKHLSIAAGRCYGFSNVSEKRLKHCYESGHTGVLEHASISFLVEGISRACSHQLVRHRMASYLQESQRYCKYSLEGDDWYVVPPAFDKNMYLMTLYNDRMQEEVNAYRDAILYGAKAEDARYLLPEAMKTVITVTVNVRSLFHFFDLRLGQHAQWEIRELAAKMLDIFEKEEPFLAEMYKLNRDKTKID